MPMHAYRRAEQKAAHYYKLLNGVSPTFSEKHTLSKIRQGFISVYIR
jgi:hypothetical protein